MKGILNLYKPRGITSSDAVVACRKILGTKAIGHMGTLDPAGEGILLLGVGKATRLFDYFLGKDKVYEAEFRFGYETETLDGDGKITNITTVLPTMRDIECVLGEFTGKQMQIPPKYSAKSIGGVRAYKLAREGRRIEIPACEIEIYSLELICETDANTYLFRIHCSSGTYIRSLCRDLAYRLGSLSTMVSIKRTRCGNFDVSDSVTLDELGNSGEKALVSVERAIESLPKVELPDEYHEKLLNGIKFGCENLPQCDFALYARNELFGIAHTVDGTVKVKTYLRD